MTPNFVLYMRFAFLHIAFIRYDHDDTGQAASTVLDILISKKRSLEFVFLRLFFFSTCFLSQGHIQHHGASKYLGI